MKLISKLALGIIFICSTIGAHARTPISLGVKAGLGISNLSGSLDDNKTRTAFNAGLTVDFEVLPSFYLVSGLEFTTKPIQGTFGYVIGDLETGMRGYFMYIKAHASYLQMPIHAAYKYKFSQKASISLHAGPYIAYGIGGKAKVLAGSILIYPGPNVIGETILVSGEGKTFSNDGFDRFDFGLSGGLTFEFKRFNVNVDYDMGLNKYKEENLEIKNGKVYFSLGYKFFTN